MVMMMGMMGTAQQALLAFPQERPIFLREYSTNHYSVGSYFLARFTIEAVVTAIQILLMVIVSYWLVGFQMSFTNLFLIMYGLAMASTALSVWLGCVVEDPKLGQEMLPVLFVPQLLFSGFFVAPELMPSWLSWARYIFSLTYAVRIGATEEFGEGTCVGGEQANAMCGGLMDSLDANEDDKWWNWVAMLGLFAFFRLLALYILRRKATKFF
jgi:ABC-type multidrug transport system permease subunit